MITTSQHTSFKINRKIDAFSLYLRLFFYLYPANSFHLCQFFFPPISNML